MKHRKQNQLKRNEVCFVRLWLPDADRFPQLHEKILGFQHPETLTQLRQLADTIGVEGFDIGLGEHIDGEGKADIVVRYDRSRTGTKDETLSAIEEKLADILKHDVSTGHNPPATPWMAREQKGDYGATEHVFDFGKGRA